MYDVIRPQRLTEIVDVGAADIDTAPPYLGLLKAKRCVVVGLDPQKELWPPAAENRITLPDVIGDGTDAVLHICDAPGMTGLFEPDKDALEMICARSAGGVSWGKVIETRAVQTRRLDDIASVQNIDYLKIDAQGAELMAIQGGRRKLA